MAIFMSKYTDRFLLAARRQRGHQSPPLHWNTPEYNKAMLAGRVHWQARRSGVEGLRPDVSSEAGKPEVRRDREQ